MLLFTESLHDNNGTVIAVCKPYITEENFLFGFSPSREVSSASWSFFFEAAISFASNSTSFPRPTVQKQADWESKFIDSVPSFFLEADWLSLLPRCKVCRIHVGTKLIVLDTNQTSLEDKVCYWVLSKRRGQEVWLREQETDSAVNLDFYIEKYLKMRITEV